MSKLKSYWTSLRAFTIFWIIANSILALGCAKLWNDSFSVTHAVIAFLCVNFVLFFAHEMNNLIDYIRGVDKLEEGSQAKAYTAASQLLPSGQMTTAETTALGLACLTIGTMCLYFIFNIYTLIFAAIGVFLAITYTPIFKRYGFQELALALGHGIATTCFVYSAVAPFSYKIFLTSAIPAIFAAGMITLDAWKDIETDLASRVKSYAQKLFELNVSPGSYGSWIFSVVVLAHFALILLNILPAITLAALFTIPLFHLSSVMINQHFDKGFLLYLIGMWAYPLMIGGALLL